MNEKEYNKHFYNFLLDKKYIIYKKHNSFEKSRFYAIKEEKQNEMNYSYSKLSSFEYLKNPLNIGFKNLEDDCSLDFFIELFKKSNKEDQMFLIKNINSIIYWKNKFFVFLDIIEKDKLIPFILSLPISLYDLNSINVTELDIYLDKRLSDKKTIDSFFIKFFKNRKNQLKPNNKAIEIKNFLIKKYQKDKKHLEPYFPFFNAIKNEFCEVDLNFIESSFTYSVATRINCRKASQLLCIPGYTDEKIHTEIEKFINLSKEHYNFEFCNVSIINNNNKTTEVIIYSNKPIQQETINEDIKKFLLFKKENTNFISNEKTIKNWFIEKELKSELINSNKNIKKFKI